jgi:hypothetical protein
MLNRTQWVDQIGLICARSRPTNVMRLNGTNAAQQAPNVN